MTWHLDHGPVAIVGAACDLPGADTLEAYWSLLIEGRCQLGPVPDTSWSWERYTTLHADEHHHRPLVGAVLPDRDIPLMRYRVPPSEHGLVHRVEGQLIALIERALGSVATFDDRVDRTRVATIIGSMGLGLGSSNVFTLATRGPDTLAGLRQVAEFTELGDATRAAIEREFMTRFLGHIVRPSGMPADLAAWTASGIAAGRVCNALDLRGPHLSIDAGEASALAAIEAAARQLRHHDQDIVIVAAHAPLLNPVLTTQLSLMGLLGDRAAAPFDDRGAGFVLAEGMGAIVLKRLADSVRDGDRIYGVVRGIGGASQGRRRVAPMPDDRAIAQAIERAYALAGYGPDAVDFVECHAAGHPDWDAAELAALHTTFGPARKNTLTVGGVKSLIGNQLAGAGMSGFLKVLLAMQHRTLPPEPRADLPRPALRDSALLRSATEAAPWSARDDGLPLRAGVTALGMAGTHYHVTIESYAPDYHARLLAGLPARESREQFAIAVVGMGVVVPGASDVPALRETLASGTLEISNISAERWGRAAGALPHLQGPSLDGTPRRLIYLTKGGFVRQPVPFHPAHPVPPRRSAAMDRSQRWIIECARQALGSGSSRTDVFIGYAPKCEREVDAEFRLLQRDLTMHLTASLQAAGVAEPTRSTIAAAAEANALANLAESTEETLPAYQGCFHAARVALMFGLVGPSMAIDSACASSLASLELGCRALLDGDCDRAVVGGTWSNLTPEYYAMFSVFQVLCKESTQDPLGPNASGFIPGEGAGALVLKRLDDARRDGDVVHAVIRAVAGSSDGQGKTTYAVNPAGLLGAVQRALRTASAPADSVALVEAHAVSAPAGDVAEIEAYAAAYGHGGPVALSFIKGNFGHLHTAAGAVALIKTIVALEHGEIFPAAGFTRLNPDASIAGTTLRVPTSLSRWPSDSPRRAGVTSFGMGGTNYHVIVDGPPPVAREPERVREAVREAVRVAERDEAERDAAERDDELVAVVGADAHFAGGERLEEFWANAVAGTPALRALPADRWDPRDYSLDAEPAVPLGGFLDPTKLEFPWRKFRVPPLQAQRMPPMDRLLFRVVHGALAHAGYDDLTRLPRADTAIIVGSMGPLMDPTSKALVGFRAHEIFKALDMGGAARVLPPEQREAFAARVRALLTPKVVDISGDVSGSPSIMAGRIANLLGFRGMHMGVDAEAASALAALDVASAGLLSGDFDVAIVAALSPWLTPFVFEAYGRLGVLAQGGGVEPAATPRFHLGEGGGALVLKRLSDAQRDGDRVLGVIRAIGSAHHGRGRVLTALSSPVIERAMRDALHAAKWPSETIGYVECQSPQRAAPAGDDESRAMRRVFGDAPAAGSAADTVGHALSASGMAGVLRALVAVDRGRMPDAHDTHAWPAGMRRAGVTAWGRNGAAYHLLLEQAPREAALVPRPRPVRRPLNVAIVGMGGVFPDAGDVPSLWNNVRARRSAIREVPAERWDAAAFYNPSPNKPGRIYSRLGAFVADLPAAALLESLTPSARARVDRSHVMGVVALREAMHGRTIDVERSRIGVVMADMDWRGAEIDPNLWLAFLGLRRPLREALVALGCPADDAARVVAAAQAYLENHHKPLTEDTLPGLLGSMAAGHIARTIDATGPNLVVESTCASSLASLYVAANLLRTGRSDLVVTGGVFANLTPEYYLANCSFRALSPTGIRPFDACADGFVPGEGAGVLLLKRLEDAERAGDDIQAVILGIGGSSDGGGSILAPNASAQALAVRRALEQGGASADSVRYVECHGAGTALGDLTELDAYAEAYADPHASRRLPLGLTSLKSMIGHLASAAGVAGVVKTALALRDQVLPPSLGYETPNESQHLASGRFEVLTDSRAWDSPGPRRAGVSGFGLGGTNFHLVMEAYTPSPAAPAAQRADPALSSERLVQSLTAGTAAQAMVECARAQCPGGRVVAIEALRMIELFPIATAPDITAVVVGDGDDGGQRGGNGANADTHVVVRLIDRDRSPRVYAQGTVVLADANDERFDPAAGMWTAQALDAAIARTDPATNSEWTLLDIGRIDMARRPDSPRRADDGTLREGRLARVSSVGEGSSLAVHDARWWSPAVRWRDDPFAPDGSLLRPSDHPFVDRRVGAAVNELEVVRDLTLDREPYLLQHRLDGTPVVPGAVHVETLVEAAALLWPDVSVKEIRDFRVTKAVKLLGHSLPLRAIARGSRPAIETTLVSDFIDAKGRTLVKDRLHAHAQVVLGEQAPPIAVADPERLAAWIARGGSSPAGGYDDPQQTLVGPQFWSIRWFRVFGHDEILTRVERPPNALFGHTRAPRFYVDPLLLDACFQTAALLGIWRRGITVLPAGFDLLRLYGAPDARAPLYVDARCRERGEGELTYDIDAFDETGRVCWRMEGYEEYSLFPVDAHGMAKFRREVATTHIDEPLCHPERGACPAPQAREGTALVPPVEHAGA